MLALLRRLFAAPASLQTRNQVIRWRMSRIIPGGLLIGAGMETFMIQTGFYDIALRKAAERRQEVLLQEEQYWKERRAREMNLHSKPTETPTAEQVPDKH